MDEWPPTTHFYSKGSVRDRLFFFGVVGVGWILGWGMPKNSFCMAGGWGGGWPKKKNNNKEGGIE